MKILGAGMAGCLAALAFPEATIEEFQRHPNVHRAILRFRSDAISKFTGIPFKEVTVHKAIYFRGDFVECTPKLANMYSQKVIGNITDRSIWDLRPATRWIAPTDFHNQLIRLCAERITYNSNINLSETKEIIVSTLPMPVLSKKLGILVECNQTFKPISVTTLKVDDCDAYQTIYYPNGIEGVYRASLQGDRLIIESTSCIHNEQIQEVVTSFNIQNAVALNINHEQSIGKIDYCDKKEMEEILYRITIDNGIYSLGRSAIWRNILLDDTLKDIFRIKEMMAKTNYELQLGK